MSFNIDPSAYYREDELAYNLGTTGQSFRTWKTRGHGPAHLDVKGVGRLYRGEDILKWLENNRHEVGPLPGWLNVERAVCEAVEHVKFEVAARVVEALLQQIRDHSEGKKIPTDLGARAQPGEVRQ